MSRISLKSMTPARRVAVLGIGIALYVVLSLAIQVPFFENYYLCLGYVALAETNNFSAPATMQA